MKLAIFGANVSSGNAMTTVPERLRLDWDLNVSLAQQADRAGIEAFIPVARWKGLGGETNPWGESFESYTWAAGLAAVTDRITIFATSHVMTVHPVMAAKQLTTIDWISKGRVGLNVVAGWFMDELAMFGVGDLSHDDRYALAAEWIEIVRRLWLDQEEFDFDGQFFVVTKGSQQPKPLHAPHPPIMNAGYSSAGNRLAAQYSDMAFVALHTEDTEVATRKVDALRSLARNEFDRELEIWTPAYVVCRSTEEEARAYLKHYSQDHADTIAAENHARTVLGNAQISDDARSAMLKNFAAGTGGHALVGTPTQIVEQLSWLSKVGIDGVTLSWVDFEHEVPQWIEQVMPLMVDAGLRTESPGASEAP